MSRVRVRQGEKIYEIAVQPGESLLSALRRAGFSLPAACGGRGRCGKCRVQVNGAPRLACKVFPQGGEQVALPETVSGVILGDTLPPPPCQPGRTGLSAAVDLGTTTVVAKLYDRADGRELAAQRAWNAQAPYGADVISRIQHTMDTPEGLKELSGRIREQIWTLLEAALSAANRPPEALNEIVVAGNTVMESLLAGRSVAGMAAAPFHPDSLFFGPEGMGELNGVPVRLLPCVAGYVGGDITAGLMASGLGEQPGEHLFLDVGTNGEMAMGGQNGFSCCAVASGPAFEGAGIQCGMPGVAGAVSHVRYDRGFLYDVIGDGPARGLCGSGLVDLAAVLLKLGIIAPGGRLLPPEEVAPELRRYVERDGDGNGLFHLTPQVYLTAGDVRNLQLAKAAVAAGIEVLSQRRGVLLENVEGLYLAGGFGTYIDPASAMAIGMLSPVLAGKVRPLGNTALAGAAALALDSRLWPKVEDTARSCAYIELSGQPDFTQAFTGNMGF